MIYAQKRFIKIINSETGELLNTSLILTGTCYTTLLYKNKTPWYKIKNKKIEHELFNLCQLFNKYRQEKESYSFCVECNSATEYHYRINEKDNKTGNYIMTCCKCSFEYYLLIDSHVIGNNIDSEKEVF